MLVHAAFCVWHAHQSPWQSATDRFPENPDPAPSQKLQVPAIDLLPVCFQVIMRSGQPLTGTNGRRCKEDEKLINATLRAGKRGYLIDTRSLNVAQQARAKGGGFEQEAHYPQWRRIHKSIER